MADTPTAPNAVPAVNANGGAAMVDPDTLAGLQDQGWRPATPEEYAAEQARIQAQSSEQGPLPALEAGVESGLSTATFGASTWAEKALGVSPEAIAAREQAHPIARFVGGLGGIAVPLALSGGLEAPGAVGEGLNLGARGILGGAPGVISQLGRATVRSLTPGIGRVGATAAGSAIEGAFYGLGQSVSEDALDPNLSAESVLARGGMDALLGAGIGLPLGAGAGLIAKAIDGIPTLAGFVGDKDVGYTLKQVARTRAVQQFNRIVGSHGALSGRDLEAAIDSAMEASGGEPVDMATLVANAKGEITGRDAANSIVREWAPRGLVDTFDGPEDVLRKSTEYVNQNTPRIAAIAKSADDTVVPIGPIVAKAREDALGYLQDPVRRSLPDVKKAIKSISETLAGFGGDFQDGVRPSQLLEMKRSIEKSIRNEAGIPGYNRFVYGMTKVSHVVNDALKDAIHDSGGDEALEAFNQANRATDVGLAAQRAAQAGVDSKLSGDIMQGLRTYGVVGMAANYMGGGLPGTAGALGALSVAKRYAPGVLAAIARRIRAGLPVTAEVLDEAGMRPRGISPEPPPASPSPGGMPPAIPPPTEEFAPSLSPEGLRDAFWDRAKGMAPPEPPVPEEPIAFAAAPEVKVEAGTEPASPQKTHVTTEEPRASSTQLHEPATEAERAVILRSLPLRDADEISLVRVDNPKYANTFPRLAHKADLANGNRRATVYVGKDWLAREVGKGPAEPVAPKGETVSAPATPTVRDTVADETRARTAATPSEQGIAERAPAQPSPGNSPLDTARQLGAASAHEALAKEFGVAPEELSASEPGIRDASGLSNGARSILADLMPPGKTLAAAVKENPTKFITALSIPGEPWASPDVIAKYAPNGQINAEGVKHIEQMLVGRIVGSGNLYDHLSASEAGQHVLGKVARIAPILTHVGETATNFDAVPLVRSALRIVNEAATRGLSVKQLLREAGGEVRTGPEIMASLLAEKSPTAVLRGFRAWESAALGKEAAVTPQQALKALSPDFTAADLVDGAVAEKVRPMAQAVVAPEDVAAQTRAAVQNARADAEMKATVLGHIEREQQAVRKATTAVVNDVAADRIRAQPEHVDAAETMDRAKKVNALISNPGAVAEKTGALTEGVTQHAPKTTAAMTQAVGRAVSGLQPELPTATPLDPLSPPAPPPRAKVVEFKRRLDALTDPLGALRRTAFAPEVTQTVQSVYPSLWRELQVGTLATLAAGARENRQYSPAQRRQIGAILGQDLSHSSGNVIATQAWATPPPPPMGKPSRLQSKPRAGTFHISERATPQFSGSPRPWPR